MKKKSGVLKEKMIIKKKVKKKMREPAMIDMEVMGEEDDDVCTDAGMQPLTNLKVKFTPFCSIFISVQCAVLMLIKFT